MRQAFHPMDEALRAQHQQRHTQQQLEQDGGEVGRQADARQVHVVVGFGAVAVVHQAPRGAQGQGDVGDVGEYQQHAEGDAHGAQLRWYEHGDGGEAEGDQEEVQVTLQAAAFRADASE